MNIELYPGAYASHKTTPQYLEIVSTNGVQLRLYVINDYVIRFRYAPEVGFESDFSYALDPNFKPENIEFKVVESDKTIELKTAQLKVIIDKGDFKTKVLDLQGFTIIEDEKGFHWEENKIYGGNIVQMSKATQENEHYYGLGDKPVHPNLRGKRFKNWGMDEYGFHRGTDPLYKSIPFYTGLHNDVGYGIFFDNTFKSYFDFASERKTVTSFWANGGEMNYYFIYGPEMIDVTARYTEMTGRPELPPLWALGYHQCKWSYYPESKVREVTTKFRELNIPCDAFYLDIDYMDGFRCFTWDGDKFPQPKQLVDDLKAQGYKTIVIIDPGIKIDKDYDVFNEGLAKDVYCRRADGPHIKGKVWPGDCYFPDFTKPEVREWWSTLFENMIGEIGVKGVWNDMNEPALFEVEGKSFPPDVRHDYDGHPCSHRKAHNIYGMQMSRATYEGLKKYSKPDRPFVITRSTYSGGQRFTSAWTGDNIASWEHLWLANVQVQRMNVSGFSFIGSDVGGFIEHPTPELYIRWVQLATFHPFFRTHSSGDHGDQEPWSFGEEALAISRKFIEIRYMFLPYLYTSFYQYVTNGKPMVRPISMYDQHDPETLNRADETMIGDHILICPVIEPNSKGRYVYLPKGNWYYYWNDTLHEGSKEDFITYKLDTSPIFIKAGAVIANHPKMQYVGEKKIENLDLHIYLGTGKELSTLYEDKGDGYDYEEGGYLEKSFVTDKVKNQYIITQSIIGNYEEEYGGYKITLHGFDGKLKNVIVDETPLDISNISYKDIDKKTEFFVNKRFSKMVLS